MKNRKVMVAVLASGLAASTLACGVVNNLVDRAVQEAEEAVVEQVEGQIEEQVGEEVSLADLQATANAAEEQFGGLEDYIPEEFGATGESGFVVMDGGVVLIEDATMINYTLDGATVADVSAFYRDLFIGMGMSEKVALTVESDLSASITFINDPSGANDIALAVSNMGDSVLVTVAREADY